MKFTILSFHPFSLYENGGGSRILRRMYEGYEDRVTSLFVNIYTRSLPKGAIHEIAIQATPTLSVWMRWIVRSGVLWLQKNWFHTRTVNKIQKKIADLQYDVVHVVDHGPYSAAIGKIVKRENKQLWVSFHDHFSFTGGSCELTEELWNQAHRRLVISEELGTEYQRLFTNRDYEIFTDGVAKSEIATPKEYVNKKLIIYFAGLLHIDYLPLFMVLAESLNRMTSAGYDITLILRGTQVIDFLDNAQFNVIYKPFTLNNQELKHEMDSADILYLPMKFTDKNFYMFSLSTKMVGYLGTPGVILYHGPEDSAASRLLQRSDAALFSFDLDPNNLYKTLTETCKVGLVKSQNAKILANDKFNIDLIRRNFWHFMRHNQ